MSARPSPDCAAGQNVPGYRIGFQRAVGLTSPPSRSDDTTSRIPEPQIPTGGRFSIVCQMIFPFRQRARSMAPGAARIPSWMCAPSNAGPEAHEQQETIPFVIRLISVLVPMSKAIMLPVIFHASVASSMATWSAPTYPAMTGGSRHLFPYQV